MRHYLTKSHNLHKMFAILCLMALPLFINGCKEKQQPSEEQAQQDNRPLMRIAFVGNEYLTTNNMFYMVQLMAQSDPSSHFKVEVGIHFMPEGTLVHLLKNPSVKTFFPQNKWDYVILQPHHMWAASEGHVYITQKSISAWSRLLTDMGSQSILFMNWPLERRNSTYSDLKYMSTLKNYRNMHRMIRGYSKSISKKNGMLLVPVGDYWMHAMDTAPDINLYGANGSIPTMEGSYLTALIIYKTLVDNTLNDIVYSPPEMSEETKKALIAIASAKVKN